MPHDSILNKMSTNRPSSSMSKNGGKTTSRIQETPISPTLQALVRPKEVLFNQGKHLSTRRRQDKRPASKKSDSFLGEERIVSESDKRQRKRKRSRTEEHARTPPPRNGKTWLEDHIHPPKSCVKLPSPTNFQNKNTTTTTTNLSKQVPQDEPRNNDNPQKLPSCMAAELLRQTEYVSFVHGGNNDDDKSCFSLPLELPTKVPNQKDEEQESSVGQMVLASLLDAMGFQVQPRGNDDALKVTLQQQQSVPPKPSSVRDLAMLQISLATANYHSPKPPIQSLAFVLRDVMTAFRVAAHSCLVFWDAGLDDANQDEAHQQPQMKKQSMKKMAESVRRAMMVLVVALRGVLLGLAEQLDSSDDKSPPMSALYSAGESFSQAESILLDIVPLLTQFVHPPLGDKHAQALLQNLLQLDHSLMIKKRFKQQRQHGGAREVTRIVRDGLMEVWVRQLCQQEGGLSPNLLKCLRKQQNDTKLVGGTAASYGALAATVGTELSDEAWLAMQDVQAHRETQQSGMKQRQADRRKRQEEKRQRQEQDIWDFDDHEDTCHKKGVVTDDGSSSSTTACRSPSIPQNLSPDVNNDTTDRRTEDTGLLRIDGCIYLWSIASKLLDSHTAATETTSQEDSLHKTRQQLCLTAYFLFHTLIQRICGDEPHSTALDRGHLTSAVLSCLLLAGKMHDCPVRIKSLLGLAKDCMLPPPPLDIFLQNKQLFKRNDVEGPTDTDSVNEKTSEGKNTESLPAATMDPSKEDTGNACPENEIDTSESTLWGAPCPKLVKHYELKLLALFGFHMPHDISHVLHPTAYLEEFREEQGRFGQTDSIMDDVEMAIHSSVYTHSGLCLIQQPRLVVASCFTLACHRARRSRETRDRWSTWLVDTDLATIKVVERYMRKVVKCVRARREQWKDFEKYKEILKDESPVCAHSIHHDTTETIPGSRKDDDLPSCFSPPTLPPSLVEIINSVNGTLNRFVITTDTSLEREACVDL